MLKHKKLYDTKDICLKNSPMNEDNIDELWDLVRITQIETLDLSYNNFGRLYKEVGNKVFCLFDGLKNLKRLDLSHNKISLTHPNILNTMPRLIHLNLSENAFSNERHLRFIRNLKTLKELDISGHQMFTMSIASFVKILGGGLPELVTLDIRASKTKSEITGTNKKNLLKKLLKKYFPKLKKYNGQDLESEDRVTKKKACPSLPKSVIQRLAKNGPTPVKQRVKAESRRSIVTMKRFGKKESSLKAKKREVMKERDLSKSCEPIDKENARPKIKSPNYLSKFLSEHIVNQKSDFSFKKAIKDANSRENKGIQRRLDFE